MCVWLRSVKLKRVRKRLTFHTHGSCAELQCVTVLLYVAANIPFTETTVTSHERQKREKWNSERFSVTRLQECCVLIAGYGGSLMCLGEQDETVVKEEKNLMENLKIDCSYCGKVKQSPTDSNKRFIIRLECSKRALSVPLRPTSPREQTLEAQLPLSESSLLKP